MVFLFDQEKMIVKVSMVPKMTARTSHSEKLIAAESDLNFPRRARNMKNPNKDASDVAMAVVRNHFMCFVPGFEEIKEKTKVCFWVLSLRVLSPFRIGKGRRHG